MIIRWSAEGEELNNKRYLWRNSTDCEICTTQYSHPSITGGLHTNGPVSIWIRRIGGEWIYCHERNVHQVRQNWIEMGIEWFELVDKENGR